MLDAILLFYACLCFVLTLICSYLLVRRYTHPSTSFFPQLLAGCAYVSCISIIYLVPIDLLPSTGASLRPAWQALFWISFLLMWVS